MHRLWSWHSNKTHLNNTAKNEKNYLQFHLPPKTIFYFFLYFPDRIEIAIIIYNILLKNTISQTFSVFLPCLQLLYLMVELQSLFLIHYNLLNYSLIFKYLIFSVRLFLVLLIKTSVLHLWKYFLRKNSLEYYYLVKPILQSNITKIIFVAFTKCYPILQKVAMPTWNAPCYISISKLYLHLGEHKIVTLNCISLVPNKHTLPLVKLRSNSLISLLQFFCKAEHVTIHGLLSPPSRVKPNWRKILKENREKIIYCLFGWTFFWLPPML